MLVGFRFFFFNATAPTEIYTLSLHDALPISWRVRQSIPSVERFAATAIPARADWSIRSEEHTSELQSPVHLVCRLLLEKKKNKDTTTTPNTSTNTTPKAQTTHQAGLLTIKLK